MALRDAFLEALPEAVRDRWAGVASLESALAELVARAKVDCDGPIDGPRLCRSAALRLRPSADVDAIGSLHAGDLWLAVAAAAGDAPAVEAIETRYGPAIDAALAELPASERDEVRQKLREKLYVGPPARIEGYLGRGPLSAWLKISAKRAWLDHNKAVQRRREDGADPDAAMLNSVGEDPELEFLKAHYGAEVRHAIEAALAELPTRDRNMLRQHFVFGMKLGEVARLNDVHRATIHRWLASAREQLRARVREELCARLGVEDGDLSSIIAVVRSRVDLPL